MLDLSSYDIKKVNPVTKSVEETVFCGLPIPLVRICIVDPLYIELGKGKGDKDI